MIGPAILFDLDEAEDFIMKKDKDKKTLRRRAENLEIAEQNESHQIDIIKLRVWYAAYAYKIDPCQR